MFWKDSVPVFIGLKKKDKKIGSLFVWLLDTEISSVTEKEYWSKYNKLAYMFVFFL